MEGWRQHQISDWTSRQTGQVSGHVNANGHFRATNWTVGGENPSRYVGKHAVYKFKPGTFLQWHDTTAAVIWHHSRVFPENLRRKLSSVITYLEQCQKGKDGAPPLKHIYKTATAFCYLFICPMVIVCSIFELHLKSSHLYRFSIFLSSFFSV